MSETAPIRLVTLDFDGTLADSYPWFVSVVNDLAARHRFSTVRPGEEGELRRLDARSLLTRLNVPLWKVPRIARDARARMRAEIDGIPLFPGTGEALERLAGAGIRLAIVSSNSEENVRAKLGTLGRLISSWECGASLFGKRRGIARAARRLGCRPDATIHVGDEIRDMEAARAAGCRFAAATWGYTAPEALIAAGPDLAPRDLGELAERIIAGPRA